MIEGLTVEETLQYCKVTEFLIAQNLNHKQIAVIIRDLTNWLRRIIDDMEEAGK